MKKPVSAQAELSTEQQTAIRRIVGTFSRDVPQKARMQGHYKAREDDRLADEEVDAPNGRYRVTGSDWIITIKNKRFTIAQRAAPPDFGGKGVIAV